MSAQNDSRLARTKQEQTSGFNENAVCRFQETYRSKSSHKMSDKSVVYRSREVSMRCFRISFLL